MQKDKVNGQDRDNYKETARKGKESHSPTTELTHLESLAVRY